MYFLELIEIVVRLSVKEIISLLYFTANYFSSHLFQFNATQFTLCLEIFNFLEIEKAFAYFLFKILIADVKMYMGRIAHGH